MALFNRAPRPDRRQVHNPGDILDLGFTADAMRHIYNALKQAKVVHDNLADKTPKYQEKLLHSGIAAAYEGLAMEIADAMDEVPSRERPYDDEDPDDVVVGRSLEQRRAAENRENRAEIARRESGRPGAAETSGNRAERGRGR